MIFLILTLGLLATNFTQSAEQAPQFFGHAQNIPHDIACLMTGRSWKPECPVPLSDLRYLTISHWGYDDMVHIGHLVVHATIAQEILEIFEELFAAKFPIERMELIDLYDADDECSMEANNTSAFCCRANTTTPGVFSNHSYGTAIDINPLINPYVKGTHVLPKGGSAYLDRTHHYKGMITDDPDNPCYCAFKKRGYEWGGHFVGCVDYQHFAK